MSATLGKFGSCWKRFCDLHGLWKVAVGSVLILSVLFDFAPNALRWPARIFGYPLFFWGFVESIIATRGRSWQAIMVSTARHPMTWVLGITGLNLVIGEEYPFSDFPMYADPGPTSDYYFLATVDENGQTQGLPGKLITGITPSKAGKIYRSYRDKFLKSHNKKQKDLTDEDRRRFALAVLEDLRADAIRLDEKRRSLNSPLANYPLEDIWRFVRIDITVDGPEIIETEVILAERDFSKP